MCQLFINADSTMWTSKTRSLRIDGVVTSIRLEHFFWDVLAEIAHRDDMTVNQLITKLYLESLDADHDVGNFTSFLRVCCSRYLSLVADGVLKRTERGEALPPLAGVNASDIIEDEQQRTNTRQLAFTGSKQSTIN